MARTSASQDFDTPEPQTQICGGAAEVELAHRASASNEWTIERFGYDSTSSKRRLAHYPHRWARRGADLTAKSFGAEDPTH